MLDIPVLCEIYLISLKRSIKMGLTSKYETETLLELVILIAVDKAENSGTYVKCYMYLRLSAKVKCKWSHTTN